LNKSLIIAGVAIIALVIALFFILSEPTGGPGELSREDEIDRQTSDPTREYIEQDGELVDGTDTAVSYEQVLEDYRRWAQYPPNSRPLKANYFDQIEHHWIPLEPKVMPIVGADGKLVEGKHSCLLQPLNHTVTEGQVMEVTLRCAPPAEGAPGVPLEIQNIKLVRYFNEKEWQVPTPEVTEGTKENDYTYKLTYRPRAEDWGDMDLVVDFKVPSEKNDFTHTLKGYFFSSPVAPAQFRGIAGERIDDDGLVIIAEVAVRFPGRYTIEANLFNDDGPVGVSRTDVRLKAGPQNVEIKFFGKVFHDQNAPGPYKVVGLRGSQDTTPLDPVDLNKSPEEVEKLLAKLESTEPQRRQIPTWEGDYRTEPYKLDVFSGGEWDSPEKRERLEELRELAELAGE
jgi:hypothetical protein